MKNWDKKTHVDLPASFGLSWILRCVFKWESWPERCERYSSGWPWWHSSHTPLLIKFWTSNISFTAISVYFFRCLYVSFQRGSGSRNMEIWRWLWLGGGGGFHTTWYFFVGFSSLPHFTIFTRVKNTSLWDGKVWKLRTYGILMGKRGYWKGFLFLTCFLLVRFLKNRLGLPFPFWEAYYQTANPTFLNPWGFRFRPFLRTLMSSATLNLYSISVTWHNNLVSNRWMGRAWIQHSIILFINHCFLSWKIACFCGMNCPWSFIFVWSVILHTRWVRTITIDGVIIPINGLIHEWVITTFITSGQSWYFLCHFCLFPLFFWDENKRLVNFFEGEY